MKFLKFPILIVAFGLFLTACDTNEFSSDENGRITVRLTDAPFPHDLVAEANVTIFKIEIRNKEGFEDQPMDSINDAEDMEPNGNSPFMVLMEDEVDINLLELTNGVTETLVSSEIPAGTYDLIRVYVKGVNVVLKDSTVYDLKVPSGEQTGIKVFIKPGLTVVGGLSADLLLDFDVSRSFVPKGNRKNLAGINGFNFKPVIKASNLSTAGTLKGSVSTLVEEVATALEGAQISVFASDTLNTSGFSNPEGNYAIMGLDAGTYKVLAELEGYIPSDTVEVQISPANVTIQDFVLEADSTAVDTGG